MTKRKQDLSSCGLFACQFQILVWFGEYPSPLEKGEVSKLEQGSLFKSTVRSTASKLFYKLCSVNLVFVDEFFKLWFFQSVLLFIDLLGTNILAFSGRILNGKHRTSTLDINQRFSIILEGYEMCKILQINLEHNAFVGLFLGVAYACCHLEGPEKSCRERSCLALFTWRSFVCLFCFVLFFKF